jgi:hypothetical protein
MFRKEGNLFIDVYEGLLGKPAHKFIAVPNLLVQKAEKIGFGDTKAEALKNCLKRYGMSQFMRSFLLITL